MNLDLSDESQGCSLQQLNVYAKREGQIHEGALPLCRFIYSESLCSH